MLQFADRLLWDDDGPTLVHVPLHSRESVLKRRGLRHIVDEERGEDPSETFARWARGLDHLDANAKEGAGPDGGAEDPSGSSARRALQEYAGDGTYFIEAYVGTPAQKRMLAVSSGSDFTSFPCEGCTRCGPLLTNFRQSASGTFEEMPCGRCVGGQREDVCDDSRERCLARGYNLVDKSAWLAYEARDYVYVGGAEEQLAEEGVLEKAGTSVPRDHGFPLVFACQTEATGWYATQVKDGVVGFSTARTSFVNQMVFQQKLPHPRFAMCFQQKLLVGDGDDMRSTGVVTLGGYNPKILDAPLVFVQNTAVQGDTRYKVYVRNIYFRKGGGQSVVPFRDGQALKKLNFDAVRFNAKNGGTILDSGVPLLILDEGIQKSFLEEWKKMVGADFTFGKMILTQKDVRSFPTIIVQIRAHDGVDKSFNPRTVPNMAGDIDPLHPFDALLAIPATHYLDFNPSTGTYRAKISLDSKLGSFLGIGAMQGHLFYYDLADDRIGFAESYNCNTLKNQAGGDDDFFLMPTFPGDGGFGDQDGGFVPEVLTPDDQGDNNVGGCTSATCISFVTVGYCIVVIALAVAYQKYKPRDRSKQFDGDGAGENWDDETEVLNPAFEKHLRGSRGGGGGFA